ncbi:MAG: hypothetical protein IJG53_01030 [Eggerthellaceae bacterium]|nr:hypothetical protein [Eggerthellaceae bacterium]
MAFRRGICPHCGNVINLPEEAETAYCPECGASVACEDAFRLAESRGEAFREPVRASVAEAEAEAGQAEPQPEPQVAPLAPVPVAVQPQPQPSAAQPQSQPQSTRQLQPSQQPQSTRQSQPSQQPQPARASLNPLNTDSLWQRDVDTPFLAQWKTDVPFTILGLLLRFMLIWTVINLTGGQAMINEALETGVLTPTRAYIIGGGLVDMACAFAAFALIPKRYRKDYRGKNYLVSLANALIGGVIFGPYWNSRLTKRRLGISYLVFFVLLATNGLSSIMMLMFV